MTSLTLLVLVCICLSQAFSFSIIGDQPPVSLTRKAADYRLNMPENNHDENPRRPLFTVQDFDASLPPHLKKHPGFDYSIKSISNDKWIFYSTSSFDYETQLRFYVFDLYVGEEFKTITLLIDNIDDEPPSFSCPENCGMITSQVYNVSTTPCTCTVSDPDGFLDQTTFTIDDSSEFEFILPSGVLYTEQSADVKLINKIPFVKSDVKILTAEVKDGAGHNTSPEPFTNITVTIEKL